MEPIAPFNCAVVSAGTPTSCGFAPRGRLLVTRACLLRSTKKEAAFVWRPHQYLVPRPLYPHPRGGIEIYRELCVRKGQSDAAS